MKMLHEERNNFFKRSLLTIFKAEKYDWLCTSLIKTPFPSDLFYFNISMLIYSLLRERERERERGGVYDW